MSNDAYMEELFLEYLDKHCKCGFAEEQCECGLMDYDEFIEDYYDTLREIACDC